MPDIYIAPSKRKKEKLRKFANHPLAALMVKPDNVRFETQKKKEKIIFLLRRHWITNLPWLLTAAVMVVVPLFLRFFPFIELLPFRYQMIVVVLWYCLTMAFILESFLSWYFNVNLVTNKRIVDIDFYSLVYREVSTCEIDKIQDVTFKMGGILRTIFNFGDIFIQTAGERPVFEFEAVPKPGLVVKKIEELIAKEEKKKK